MVEILTSPYTIVGVFVFALTIMTIGFTREK
jgi:hypothetical protein